MRKSSPATLKICNAAFHIKCTRTVPEPYPNRICSVSSPSTGTCGRRRYGDGTDEIGRRYGAGTTQKGNEQAFYAY